MRTVAEQVDRPELVGVLRELGVDDGQGFHLGRPLPLAGLLG
jgi:EAL domain-containing protein (putative c-di-GMP-specific phosphodiesterase class I)